MGQRVIADNWSLQEVSELFAKGLDAGDTPGILPLTDPDLPPNSFPQAVIGIEALFDLLTDLVLRSQILVDDRFVDTWAPSGGPLSHFVDESIIRPHPFLDHPERLEAPRQELTQRLLVSPIMAKQQHENEQSWNRPDRSTPHEFASQLVWGGAGMLARAWVYECAYTPHPLRRRLFQRAGVAVGSQPAVAEFQTALSTHRKGLFGPQTPSSDLYAAQLVLPALPALIVREAGSVGDLFVVAMQMRAELVDLRYWLSDFQEALTAGDFDVVATHRKRLRVLSAQVDQKLGKRTDTATLTLGTSWLKFATKFDPAAWWSNRNRIQVQINRLAFAPGGSGDVRKLLGMFGERSSVLGLRTLAHFCSQ